MEPWIEFAEPAYDFDSSSGDESDDEMPNLLEEASDASEGGDPVCEVVSVLIGYGFCAHIFECCSSKPDL